MRKIILSLLLVLLSATVCNAGLVDLEAANIATDAILKDLTKEIGYVIAIPSMTPSDPMGITGFDIGVEASAYKLDDSDGVLGDTGVAVTRLHVQKGLPLSIDVGLEYMKLAETNIKAFGGEIRYALTEDGVAMPAIGVRGTYSEMSGVTDVELSTYTLGAQVSKEVLFLTPYLGATHLSSKGKVKGLGSEKETNSNVYAGLNISVLLLDITLQVDMSDNTMYTLKLGISF